MTKQKIKESILAFFETQKKKSFSVEEIAEGLNLQKSADFKLLVQSIALMEREKLVEFTKKGKVKRPQKKVSLSGIFRANERGFGFVTIDSEEPDIYIPKEFVNYALDGDEVLIDITHPADPFSDRGAEGEIIDIKNRAITQVVGEFVAYAEQEINETDLYGYAIPQDKKLSDFTFNVAAKGMKPVDGSIVIIEVTHYPEKEYPKSLEGIVKKIVGHKNDLGMDILSVVVSHGIPTQFSQEVLDAANQIPETISEKDLIGRRDLRDEVIVTIDGADAKDLDDAVTVRKLANGHYFLGVHIADVSYYVTENSLLDQEAYERGTSVYLTDRVVPMIPQRLSNGICSLNPHVPRLTMSCEMEVSRTGQVICYDIFPSVIQTTQRMTYAEINAILEENDLEVSQRYQTLVPMFKDMEALHGTLEKMRQVRGAIAFDDREAKILVSDQGKPEEIILRTRGVGEKLIESFMLLANETVARHYSQLKLPFIYRIHEQPKEEKMQRFFDFAAALGIVVKGTKETITPQELQKVLSDVRDRPEELVINTMLLRSMQQARYCEDNEGHYGLAAQYYTHFTSPIRRYPDLIVHRLIRAYQTDQSENEKDKWASLLPDIADHSSKMERRAVAAEREVNAMKKAEFMLDKIGEEYEGIISSVTRFGIFVELPNTIEGLIHVKNLKQDYFHYIENHMALVGERTGLTLKIGQKIKIKVAKSNPETQEIDLDFIEAETIQSLAVTSRKKTKKTNHPTNERKHSNQKNTKKKHQKSGKKPFYKEVAKKKKKKKKK